jgi:molybdenum cofactor cytidylyltransferase
MRNIGAVILAAGGSSRFGRTKLLLQFRGETLDHRAVWAANEAGCNPVVVVVGDLGDAIRSELHIRDSRMSSSPAAEGVTRAATKAATEAATGQVTRTVTEAFVIENGAWRNGIGTSIRRGVEELAGSVEAVVLLACDQPFVNATIIAHLSAAQQKTGKRIVASSYANTIGIPALFDRSCFASLMALADESGAKALIERDADDVAAIAFEDGAIDIDTPQDFERLKENRD